MLSVLALNNSLLKDGLCNIFAFLLVIYTQTNAARTTPATQPSGHSQPAVLQTSMEPTPQVRQPQSWAGERGELPGVSGDLWE